MSNPSPPEQSLAQSPATQPNPVPVLQDLRYFKLISVTLKEAAMDSPTFRAHINHMDSELANVEEWLVALTALILKIPRQVKELRGYFNSFLEHMLPPFLELGAFDTEVTVELMTTLKRGLKKAWQIALAILDVNVGELLALHATITLAMAQYRAVKRKFDPIQEKYDKFLLIHLATPKLKDARLVMEDLAQLYTVRKEYVVASLDLVLELQKVLDVLNVQAVHCNFQSWLLKMEKLEEFPVAGELFGDIWTKFLAIKAWNDAVQDSIVGLQPDLNMAREQVQEHVIQTSVPLLLLHDYRLGVVNSRLLADYDEKAAEKHGYVYLKTATDRLGRVTWVRRWAFLQDGIFGFLVLLPLLTSVQETDKFGVLICNAKYAPNEERRFCFEVRTVDGAYILQAETLRELALWLKVFDNSRADVLAENDNQEGSMISDIAQGRYPPLVTEFALAMTTVADRELTLTRIETLSGQIITLSGLAPHLERNEHFFQKYVVKQVARICLPFSTETLRLALVAYSLTSSTTVPNALLANVWGSVNWGVQFLTTQDSDPDGGDAVIPEEKPFERQIGAGIRLPATFPNSWVARDLQMRALFELAIEPNECCLVSFNGIFSPNLKQILRSSVFITQRHLYSYIHTSCFVALGKSTIRLFVEASSTLKKDYSILKLSRLNDSFRSRIFLEDGKLVAKKVNCIIQNAASNEPKNTLGLIDELLNLEKTHAMEMQRAAASKAPDSAPPFINSIELELPQKSAHVEFKVEYDMQHMSTRVVDLPPKALFHAMFGSRSSIFEKLFPLVHDTTVNRLRWSKHPTIENALSRQFILKMIIASSNGGINTREDIETMVDNEYYNCTITRLHLKMKFGPRFDFQSRFIIWGVEGGKSLLRVYSTVNVEKGFLTSFLVEWLCLEYVRMGCGNFMRKIDDAVAAIGKTSQIVRSTYIYGKVLVTDEPLPAVGEAYSGVSYTQICHVVINGMMANFTRRVYFVVYFMLGVLKNIFSSLSMHSFLVGIIALLALLNVFMITHSSRNYWVTRQARNLANDVIHFEPMSLERAIYLKDIQELVEKKHNWGSNSTCFATFAKSSFVLNHDRPMSWESVLNDDLTRGTAIRLRKALRDIGLRRSELLVNVRMLNQLEEEIARGEWKNWLVSELGKCDFIQNSQMIQDASADATTRSGLDTLREYCRSCSTEMDALLAENQL